MKLKVYKVHHNIDLKIVERLSLDEVLSDPQINKSMKKEIKEDFPKNKVMFYVTSTSDYPYNYVSSFSKRKVIPFLKKTIYTHELSSKTSRI